MNEVYKSKDESQMINNIAGKLHESWRATRFQNDLQGYEPRIKTTVDGNWIERHKSTEVDIANTEYSNLPDDLQKENRITAEIALAAVAQAVSEGQDLTSAFIESISSLIHDKWLERNFENASDIEKIPYDDLPEEVKRKDREAVIAAVAVWHNVK